MLLYEKDYYMTATDFLFETSWEVCNKVGGIHTVLSTKANTLIKDLNDNYIPLGFNFKNIINADYINNALKDTQFSNYYFNNIYTGLVPKLEYLLTSAALMYEDDARKIIESYPSLEYKSSFKYNFLFESAYFLSNSTSL